jgi:outer membrane cobalamin receptor
MSAYVAVENLFDTEYQIVYDYPMPGRTLFAGLRWGLE